ncbi:hypothetical protein FRC14_000193 [Serendipita sp. 396]|nr:hypothetical protein FRC14_000193 [Serendipita sp. 396]KAG8787254.1 hypothetical protein FRC15_009653 [Serendipita sp. 397]KAG8801761.1 hypothetical protein FRC16_011204 [Serendipita sp. 398]KAG8821537.1 hypothetical protein FRC18_011300 [Serendipita sp. 400]KAG8867720.1 hypothetical protein FRC20_005090 [Serendipita sp. 405]
MDQPSIDLEYSRLLDGKNLSKNQIEVLLELKAFSDNLKELLSTLNTIQDLAKQHPVALRSIERQLAPLLDHFKMSLYMYIRTLPEDRSIDDLTIRS